MRRGALDAVAAEAAGALPRLCPYILCKTRKYQEEEDKRRSSRIKKAEGEEKARNAIVDSMDTEREMLILLVIASHSTVPSFLLPASCCSSFIHDCPTYSERSVSSCCKDAVRSSRAAPSFWPPSILPSALSFTLTHSLPLFFRP